MNKPQLVVLAAGMGSRYGGLKQIDPIGPNGEVLLDYSLYDAFNAGFERVVFVIRTSFQSEFREELGKHIERRADTAYVFQELDAEVPESVSIPEQREKPWGTAHAVLCARDEIDAPFAVINADDFYGPEAFGLLHDHLEEKRSKPDQEPRYCMVGYPLAKTLSEHGTVSRGICEVNDRGELIHVEEQEDIRPSEKGVEYLTDEGSWQNIDPNTPVSMNCWGFTQDLFTYLENDFSRFLEHHAEDPSSEFYITSVINRLLKENHVRLSVKGTDAEWFGVTYGKDRETAQQAIRKKIEQNMYERSLWNDQ